MAAARQRPALLTGSQLKRRARKVRCLILDIDGVMTDCKLYLTPDGQELKAVNVKDGLGIKLLMRAGIEIAVISGRPSVAMQKRLEWLGIRRIHLDVEDKLPVYEALLTELGLEPDACAVMGDDVPDLPLLQRAGLALTVADAHPAILPAVHWVSRHRGGDGAIREACDLLLDAQGAGDFAQAEAEQSPGGAWPKRRTRTH